MSWGCFTTSDMGQFTEETSHLRQGSQSPHLALTVPLLWCDDPLCRKDSAVCFEAFYLVLTHANKTLRSNPPHSLFSNFPSTSSLFPPHFLCSL